MGGGDLNLKKSWHPGLMKNQERVWKEQKKALDERKKIEQLRKERADERSLQELQQMQEAAGGATRPKRMDWMIGSANSASGLPEMTEDMERYLLGTRRVDSLVKSNAETAKLQKNAGEDSFLKEPSTVTPRVTASMVQNDPLFLMRKKEQEAMNASVEKLAKERRASKGDRKTREHGGRRRDRHDRDRDDRHHRHDRRDDRSDDERGHRSSRRHHRRHSDSASRSPAPRRHRDRDHDRRETRRRYSDRSRSRSPPRRRSRSRERRQRSPRRRYSDYSRSRSPPRRRSRSTEQREDWPGRRSREDNRTSASMYHESSHRTRSDERQGPPGEGNGKAEERARKLAEMQADGEEMGRRRKERVAAADEENEKEKQEQEARMRGDSGRFMAGVRKQAENLDLGESLRRRGGA